MYVYLQATSRAGKDGRAGAVVSFARTQEEVGDAELKETRFSNARRSGLWLAEEKHTHSTSGLSTLSTGLHRHAP